MAPAGASGAQPARTSNPEFQVRRLNQRGFEQADHIATSFDELMNVIKNTLPDHTSREYQQVKTHLQIACYWAKNASAQRPENQEQQ